MNKYTLFFGYIFYRINSIYRRFTKLAEDQQPAAIISIIQTMLIMDLFLLIYTTVFVEISLYHMPQEAMIFFSLFSLVIFFINQRLLINRYWEFDKMWRDEPVQLKQKRGWLIIIGFILVFIFGPIFLILRELLGV